MSLVLSRRSKRYLSDCSIRPPNGKALTDLSHLRAARHAFVVCGFGRGLRGQVKTGHYHPRRRRKFLDFTNEVVADQPDGESDVVPANLNIHEL
jgi:hypothetical protein